MPLNAEYAIDGVNGEEAICGGLITKVSAKKRWVPEVGFFSFGCPQGAEVQLNRGPQAKSDNRAFARTVESRGPARGRARAAAAGPVHMYAGVNSNSSGRSCDPEVRMRTDQRVPRKPDAPVLTPVPQ